MFNTKVRLLLIAFMLFSPILAYPAPAWGCTCEEPGSPEEEFVRAEAVFVGTMQTGVYDRAISFDVEHSWRGVNTTHVMMQTGDSSDDCGIRFQQGEQYLVYAYQSSDGALHADICSRTAPLASATQDLDYLQTVPKLELTDVRPMLNFQMLYLAIPLLGAMVLGVVIWRRYRSKPIA